MRYRRNYSAYNRALMLASPENMSILLYHRSQHATIGEFSLAACAPVMGAPKLTNHMLTIDYYVASSNRCHASSNRCLTSSNKDATRNKCLIELPHHLNGQHTSLWRD